MSSAAVDNVNDPVVVSEPTAAEPTAAVDSLVRKESDKTTNQPALQQGSPSSSSPAVPKVIAAGNVKPVLSSLPNVTAKPVLVTGAGGWVGSHIVYQLLEKGYRVRGTVRRKTGKKYEFLNTFHPKAKDNLELVEADLNSAAGWEEAVKGVEYVMHVASPFTYEFSDEQKDLIEPAVRGVENVYAAVLKNCAEIKRIIHTSSVVAVVYGHPKERYPPIIDKTSLIVTAAKKAMTYGKSSSLPAEGDEVVVPPPFNEAEWSVLDNISGYEKSKTLSEQKAWELINTHNDLLGDENSQNKVQLVVINPSFIFGPIFCAAHADGESSRHVARLMKRQYPFVPNVESEHVDVRDVAVAHILAMEQPSEKVAGKRFLLAAPDGRLHFCDQGEILKKNFSRYGFNPPNGTAPKVLFSIGQYFLSEARAAIDKIGKGVPVSTENAREYLGMTEWISPQASFVGHALTMIKFQALPKRSVPSAVLNAYVAY